MKRALIIGFAALAGLVAWGMSPPEDAVGGSSALPSPEPTTRSSVWYCLGAQADGDSILAAAVSGPARVEFSLPVDGEFIDTRSERSSAESLVIADVGDGLRFHPGPALVEVSATPSSVSFIVAGPRQLAADNCHTASKEWFLSGGSVGNGEVLTLRLYNPLLEPARAAIELVSEFGFEPLADIASMNIPPRAWEDVPIGAVLGDREEVAVRVVVADGVIIPGFISSTADGLAIWPGQSLSSFWEFPLAQPAGSDAVLTLWNASEAEASVSIDILETAGARPTLEVSVGAARQERIDLTTLTQGEAAVVVRSTVPVAATVRAAGPAGSAATVGAPRRGTRWLVPLNGVGADLTHRVFIANSGSESAEVIVRPLGGDEAMSLVVAPRSLGILAVPGTGAEVTSDQPVTVGWNASGRGDIALSLGTLVGPAGAS